MVTKWKQTATVKGEGYFPLDMLRYDKCYPAGEEDSAAIAGTGEREINVVHVSELRFSVFTPARWRSFGWEIVNVETEKRS